ncbi:MAG: bifunctional phosphopantothenoylcysteine decarboxylase/phosphopantothenate--cysteine ligase CoaBC [Chlorobi bacterium]|nr:bifunctional phosphopantothenoylcysteine decarboxylase/phosphopantothenate--cysteine ligase CoaBC [Chlorobiota bacterium]
MSVRGKHILLGVTGGIAAYKIPLLVRLFKKAGAEVRVIMTPAARDFVTPFTLGTLAGYPAVWDFKRGGEWVNHVEWARWADLMLIAPLTANTLAKLAHGQADNFLTATVMSGGETPVFLAPAMDLEMYRYPAVRRHLAQLEADGFHIIPPEEGELLSGLEGKGRMPEPESLFRAVEQFFTDRERSKGPLAGKKVVITAGPTYEPIDPVRFIGNRSSGKMGLALAREAHRRGADVVLITGPASAVPRDLPFEIVRVETAAQMDKAFRRHFPDADIAVMAAAVADYTPAHQSERKIKKKNERLHIELVPTPDILAYAGAHKRKDQKVIGFALETDNELENARDKLERKGADMIVLNSLREPGAGFGTDTNKVHILKKEGAPVSTPLADKGEIAKIVWDEIQKL